MMGLGGVSCFFLRWSHKHSATDYWGFYFTYFFSGANPLLIGGLMNLWDMIF